MATGDGMALAYRAGAELRDMEFVQFHPTVLYIAGGSRSLISEATRGEGAWLVDRHGHRFMPDYDPRGELAPRDVVSLAIVSQMEKTRHPNVYLDMTHLDPQRVLSRFPGIAAICAEFDLDITRDRIPVRPGAHYMMGGITVDLEGRTTLARPVGGRRSHAPPGCTGPTGWPRTACWRPWSTGPMPARGRRARPPGMHDDFSALPIENPRVDSLGEPLNLDDIRNALKSLMWRNVGVRRDGEGLAEARQNGQPLVPLRPGPAVHRSRRLGVAEHALRRPRLMIEAALERRGEPRRPRPHRLSRADDDHWNRHIVFRRDGAEIGGD